MKFLKMLFMAVLPLLLPSFLTAQTGWQYNRYSSILQKAEALAKEFPSLCTVKALSRTAAGKDVIVITIGTGNRDNKPGIAVLGGIEGNHNLGRELALGFASNLLKESITPDIKALIGKVTFYIFPDVSPDATDNFFAPLRFEQISNARPVDEDSDFSIDEDPFEDINKDGLITLIRVTDPAGTHIESDEDKRIMVPADLSKGQKGAYLVFSEGIDNDKDEKLNEDGPGGVSFNRNLTYNYEEFGKNAGLHPVSEPEVKAVIDFLYDRYNIYATFCFGPQDNLGQPMRASERQAPAASAAQTPQQFQGMTGMPAGATGMMRMTGDRRITSIMRSDETINKLVSDKYKEITGLKGAPLPRPAPGNFMEWAYYHYGRYSFSTPGWWYPVERDKNPEAAFLKYATDNKIENIFVEWTTINHPDFPGKKTEVGGLAPFALVNPPAAMLDDLIEKHYTFIVTIAAMHPELQFLDLKVENTGADIFRVSLKVHNNGLFASVAEAGEMNVFTRIMRISLETESNQKLISGQKVQRMQRLEGNKSASFSWLISGRGEVKISAGAVNTGIITTTAELK